jgi:hypothetical protein
MVQELYIFHEALQPRFFAKKMTYLRSKIMIDKKDVLNSEINVKSKYEIKMGSFHLKKQMWRRFPVFPEVSLF